MTVLTIAVLFLLLRISGPQYKRIINSESTGAYAGNVIYMGIAAVIFFSLFFQLLGA